MITLLPFFLLLITAALVSCVPAVDSKCIRSQQLSLLHFKKSLVFNASLSSKLISWNSSTDCCSWIGITCGTNGNVVDLDISNEYISSRIHSSSSLFHLQHLQGLNLAHNDFSGSHIPSAIGKLTSLRHLDLSYAGLSGQVPVEISLLTKLNVLDISTNQDTDYDNLWIQNLSMLFQNLTELTGLRLDGVDLSEQGSDWSRVVSSSMPNLKVLSLSNCDLSGPIDKSLAKLSSLSVLRLDSNYISAPIPGFIANFSNLTCLSLRDCGLQGIFPPEIFQVPSLQTIDLSNNIDLGGFLPEFSKNASLQSLVLYWTSISGVLPDSIGNLNMLSTIDLSQSNFSGSIPRSVGNLAQLVHFDLSFKGFTGSVPSFSRANNLTAIDLSANDLTGHIDSTHWKNLTNLVTLKLNDNKLQGNLPSPLFCLPLLKTFHLYNNQFSGQFPEFCNASSHYQLESLLLDDNNLEGPIPKSIFNLRGLEELFLTSNNLNGSFPLDHLHQLKYLRLLHLSYNSLLLSYKPTNFSYSSFPLFEQLRLASGNLRKFPDFLRNQSRLIFLDLSENHLHGVIPNWIWRIGLERLNLSCNSLEAMEGPSFNLTSVWLIDLHSNMLQGQIPMFLSPFIYYLDYSENNFSSSMLTDIGEYLSDGTAFFSISSNNLSGIIPESICNSPYLEVLDLSNNSLTGTVPQCVTTMRKLNVLNLRRNNFTHVNLPQNCNLRSLDVSANQLKGQFPRSVVNCTELEVLNLGSNQITDAFPCFLKNISTLRILVLRSNNFYGSTGCPETNGTWAPGQCFRS